MHRSIRSIARLAATTAILAALAVAPVEAIELGYWPLDEGAGASAADGSGTGNHGSLIGHPTSIPGVFGSALDFVFGDRVRVESAPPGWCCWHPL